MAHQQFVVSQVNPNNTVGGGGCACDASQQQDCKPPYVVFYGNSMADLMSPHVVMCQNCIEKAKEKLDTEEGLVVGERTDETNPVSDRPDEWKYLAGDPAGGLPVPVREDDPLL